MHRRSEATFAVVYHSLRWRVVLRCTYTTDKYVGLMSDNNISKKTRSITLVWVSLNPRTSSILARFTLKRCCRIRFQLQLLSLDLVLSRDSRSLLPTVTTLPHVTSLRLDVCAMRLLPIVTRLKNNYARQAECDNDRLACRVYCEIFETHST